MEPEQHEESFGERLNKMTPQEIVATTKLLEQRLMEQMASHLGALELITRNVLKDFRFKLKDGRKVKIIIR